MAQLSAVDAQNPCRFYFLQLRPLASSRLYDFYAISPKKLGNSCEKKLSLSETILRSSIQQQGPVSQNNYAL